MIYKLILVIIFLPLCSCRLDLNGSPSNDNTENSSSSDSTDLYNDLKIIQKSVQIIANNDFSYSVDNNELLQKLRRTKNVANVLTTGLENQSIYNQITHENFHDFSQSIDKSSEVVNDLVSASANLQEKTLLLKNKILGHASLRGFIPDVDSGNKLVSAAEKMDKAALQINGHMNTYVIKQLDKLKAHNKNVQFLKIYEEIKRKVTEEMRSGNDPINENRVRSVSLQRYQEKILDPETTKQIELELEQLAPGLPFLYLRCKK